MTAKVHWADLPVVSWLICRHLLTSVSVCGSRALHLLYWWYAPSVSVVLSSFFGGVTVACVVMSSP